MKVYSNMSYRLYRNTSIIIAQHKFRPFIDQLSILHQSRTEVFFHRFPIHWQCIQKSPQTFLFPTFIFPVIQSMWKPVYNIKESFIMSDANEYIWISVKVFQLVYAILRH